jgi:fructose-1,6-bisphosphatase/inositol monophosphatase family enzyme
MKQTILSKKLYYLSNSQVHKLGCHQPHTGKCASANPGKKAWLNGDDTPVYAQTLIRVGIRQTMTQF